MGFLMNIFVSDIGCELFSTILLSLALLLHKRKHFQMLCQKFHGKPNEFWHSFSRCSGWIN